MPDRNPGHPLERSQSIGVDYLDNPHDVMRKAIAQFSYLNIPMALITEMLGMGKNQMSRWRTGSVIPKPYQAFLFKALAEQITEKVKQTGQPGYVVFEQIATKRI